MHEPPHRFHRIPSFCAATPTAIGFGRARAARVGEIVVRRLERM